MTLTPVQEDTPSRQEGQSSRSEPIESPAPALTFIFRKGSPTVFSIEKLFEALYARFEAAGAHMQRLELPYISTGIGSVLRNIWFVARQNKKKVVHITGDVHYAALLCPLSKTIITVHDCVVLQRGTGFKRLVLWILWFGLPVRFASAIIVISEQTKRELLKTVAVAESKIVVIPNFIDPAFEYSQKPFSSERPRILHIGTTDNKNLPRVIAALRGIHCVLVIVGPLSPALLGDLKESGVLYENVVGIDHAAVRQLYREADIISFPSTYEGFGMPIVEGQAVGRPVLTSDLEPMRDVAGPGGALLVDAKSVESIREGFQALIQNDLLRARLVAAGRENCRRFTLEAVAAAYRQVYRRVNEDAAAI